MTPAENEWYTRGYEAAKEVYDKDNEVRDQEKEISELRLDIDNRDEKITALEDCLRECEKGMNNTVMFENKNGLSLLKIRGISEAGCATLRAVLGTK